MLKARLYQLEAVKEILEKKRILIADDMGLGKSAEAIFAKTAIENRYRIEVPTLIACPAQVSQVWEDQMRLWYKKKEESNVVQIETPTFDQDVRRARDADSVIIGYPTLSYYGGDKYKMRKLQRLGFRYGIIDEAHNSKNPDSIRGMSVKKLFDSMDYLAILTGTPVPNTVIDLYMLLSLLEPENFPINLENPKATLAGFYELFRQDPEFVRRVLNDRMLRRTVEDYLHESVPTLISDPLEVRLTGQHEEVYRAVYENDDIRPSIKLIQLQKALIDPNLVKQKYLPSRLTDRSRRMKSTVYKALDDLVKEVVNNKGKVLIFSNFREGVTDILRERLDKYGALIVDGNKGRRVEGYDSRQEVNKREFIRRRFQTDPDIRVLISTTVMDEGVDLTAATDIVHLGLPYTPAAFDQRNRRSQRVGEVKKDNVRFHIVKPTLDEFTPTIHEGMERLLDDKRRIITYLLKEPFSITRRDLEEIKDGKNGKSRHIKPFLKSPGTIISGHFGWLKGKGWKAIKNHYEEYPEEAEYFAKLYANHWEGFYSGNTANLYARVIGLLDEHEDLTRKLDIASGPFSLSRALGEPVVNVDLNEHMLSAGRLLERKGKVPRGNVAHQGFFHDLNMLKDGEFDLAVCSLGLHMSRSISYHEGKKVREREQAFREQNRILKNGGYSIITLPHGKIHASNLSSFYEGLDQLGFEILPFSGFYRGPKNSRFRVYLAGLKKISEPKVDKLDDENLIWRMDENIGRSRKGKSRKNKHTMREPRHTTPELVTEFSLVGKKTSLESLVGGMFKKA